MRKVLILCLILFLNIQLFGQNKYKATSIVVSGSLLSTWDKITDGISCQMNVDNKTYIYSVDKVWGHMRESIFDISSDNSIVLKKNTNLYSDISGGISDGVPLAVCSFKDKFYLFTVDKNRIRDNLKVYYKSPLGEWADNRWVYTNSFYFDHATSRPCDAIVFNEEMYFFYIHKDDGSLRVVNTDDGENWSSHYVIANADGSTMDPNIGNVSVCKIKDKDGTSCLMVTYVGLEQGSNDKSKKVIYVDYFYGIELGINDNNIPIVHNKGSLSDDDAIMVDCLQGSTEDGGTGNRVQVFYTSEHKDTYNHEQQFIKRIEWDVNNESFDANTSIKYSQNENNIDPDTWQPLVFSGFEVVKDENIQKKISLQTMHMEFDDDMYNQSTDQYFDFLVWNSEKFHYQPSEDTYDSETDSSLWTLVGVIEGAPPFVLNGWNLGLDPNDQNILPNSLRPITKLSYGILSSTSTAKEFSFSAKNETEIVVKGFLFGGGVFAEKESSEEHTKTIKVDFGIEPVHDEAYGYYLVLKPTIYRKKYDVLDADGNVIDDFYIFKISENHLSLLPYDMMESSSIFNPYNINTYITRSYPLNQYNQAFKHAFSATVGTDQTVSEEVESSEHTKITKGFSVAFGVDEDVPLIFKVKSKDEFEFKWTTEVTTTDGQKIEIFTRLPEKNPNSDITADTTRYDGNFYWIGPTKDQDNWWIPKAGALAGQNPWCMTWEITSITDDSNSGSSSIEVLETEDDLSISESIKTYPNPFNPTTTIAYGVKEEGTVTISIYDITGKLINTLLNKTQLVGNHSIQWNGKDESGRLVPGGIYLSRISTNNNSKTVKLLLLR